MSGRTITGAANGSLTTASVVSLGGVCKRIKLTLLIRDEERLSRSRVFFGLKAFRTTCTESVAYRASVPASEPENARLCTKKLLQNCCRNVQCIAY